MLTVQQVQLQTLSDADYFPFLFGREYSPSPSKDFLSKILEEVFLPVYLSWPSEKGSKRLRRPSSYG
jgi:hypothetical protein